MKTTSTQDHSKQKLIGYFQKPSLVFTNSDSWYGNDERTYLHFLNTLRSGLRQLLEVMLLNKEEDVEGINIFMLHNSSALAILELDNLRLLLLRITETTNKVQQEELKSLLFYQLFFVIESLNMKIRTISSTTGVLFTYLPLHQQ
jgi:hypothetical protein